MWVEINKLTRPTSPDMRVIIYSDGGADPNPGIGGWAAILQAGNQEKVLTGNSPWTTNNRMELQAAVAALQALTRPVSVDFYTDSEYLQRGITEWITRWQEAGWHRKGKPIANVDLWQSLAELTTEHEIEWHWVRGHAGNELNERVDRLARQARLDISPTAEVQADTPRLFVRASCKGNPGPGGWGVVLERESETEQLSGSEPKTTNNRMELLGIVEGLSLIPEGSAVQVFTTSDYVFTGATRWINGWRNRDWKKKDGKTISNQDLWQAIDRLMMAYKIRWINAKGKADEMPPGLIEAGRIAAEAAELERY